MSVLFAGDRLACSSHGCEMLVLEGLSVSQTGISFAATQRLTYKQLPCRCICFQSEDLLLAAGFDSIPIILRRHSSDDAWQQEESFAGMLT